jgi:hypothetical protein
VLRLYLVAASDTRHLLLLLLLLLLQARGVFDPAKREELVRMAKALAPAGGAAAAAAAAPAAWVEMLAPCRSC